MERAHLRAVGGEYLGTACLLTAIVGSGGVGERHAGGNVTIALLANTIASGAYWFTASTSFANPAVTIARSLTDTFAGIRPPDVRGFIAAQLIGAAAAAVVCGWLLRPARA